MKILFVTPSYKPAYLYGGTIVVTAVLAEVLVKSGHNVTVVTTTANGIKELDVEEGKLTDVDGVSVYYFKRNTGDHTHVSFPLWRFLWNRIDDYDVVHIHSWWNFLVLGAAWICLQKKVTPVLSPHGMFSNYILETNNSAKKKWIHKLIGKKLLQNTKLHVSTEMEWTECQHIIHNWNGAIIHNLVALPNATYPRAKNEIFTIGFLSRIDPKKGIDILIQALSKVSFSFQLLIAGSGEEKYVESLKKMAKEVGNEKSIHWLGWKNKEEKFAFLSTLDLFALTSHSENFAIVVIESLSVGTPVLLSSEVGLSSYVLSNKLGWVTSTNINDVILELERVYHEKDRLEIIRHRCAHLIANDFSPGYLVQQYVDFYAHVDG